MTTGSLQPFFSPLGVAILGASREPTKLGYGLARNLIGCGYPGAVHLVNPRGGELFGLPIYARVGDVPDPVDLAVVLAPAAQVPDSLRECGERGIRAVIIASGGFKETGPEGAALEARCLAIGQEYGMRMVGPNCIGIIDTHYPLDTTFLQPPGPARGEISFVSHSGAICAAVIDWVRGQGLGLSSLVSLGNQADVNETDMLAKVAEDRATRVITLYLEGIGSGERFVETARAVSLKKPVVALKVGRSAAGQRAAASHTGALAGSETAYEAAFQKAGVIRAGTTEEMFQWARALAWCPLPAGRRVAVLTNAGGPGVTAADALELNGLNLASLAHETETALKALLPPAASVHNPVDMLASASPEQYAGCLAILLRDPGVDSVMIIFPPPPMFSAGAVAKALIPAIQSADKPVLIALMGDRLIAEAVEHFRSARVPEYRFPEAAASALGVLSRRAEFLAAAAQPAQASLVPDGKDARHLLEGSPAGEFLPQEAVTGLMDAYGIPVARVELATSADQAAAAARRTGYPVVVKVASPDIPHKSDVGGVMLDLNDEASVREGFETVTGRARQAKPEALIQGAHLQRMIPAGQDVIVGMVRDPQFGALVMFGSGGIEVEGLKDVAFALAPLTRAEAESLLESTWAGRKLKGFRSLPPADRAAVLDALARLSQLAVDHPTIAEIEINPLRVLPEGQGAWAVDVRARLA